MRPYADNPVIDLFVDTPVTEPVAAQAVDVAVLLSKGMKLKHIARGTRRMRDAGLDWVLVNLPGNVVVRDGHKCLVTTKGKFLKIGVAGDG